MGKREKQPKARYTSIGGQAVIEGVMMRGYHDIATAVRVPDGHIEIQKEPINLPSVKWKINRIPILRGVFSFFESMYVGVKCLMFSAKFFEDDEEANNPEKMSKFERWIWEKFGDKLFTFVMFLSVLLSLVLGIGLFMLLPNFLVGFFKDIGIPTIILNLMEGAVRIIFFVSYIALISKMKDIQRVFMYHGAEHKTIFCFEHEEELTVENVRKYKRFHPRCGTSFLFIVMIVSIVLFSFISWENLTVRIVYRLLLLPVVAGLSYELIRLAGKYDNWFTRALSQPGVWMQRLTTKEPEDDMIEVAIASLQAVL